MEAAEPKESLLSVPLSAMRKLAALLMLLLGWNITFLVFYPAMLLGDWLEVGVAAIIFSFFTSLSLYVCD